MGYTPQSAMICETVRDLTTNVRLEGNLIHLQVSTRSVTEVCSINPVKLVYLDKFDLTFQVYLEGNGIFNILICIKSSCSFSS
jgi:hypothetical protein